MSFLRRLPAPSEGVRLRQPDTEAVLGGRGLGCGCLYVAESRLSWIENSGLGFSLDYPTISLHAISRDLNAYPWEHLYVLVNAKFEGEESKETPMGEGEEEEEEEEENDDEAEPISEFRFVPSDKSALEAMFSAMCECQALHPDPEDEDSDNNYNGDEYDVEDHEPQDPPAGGRYVPRTWYLLCRQNPIPDISIFMLVSSERGSRQLEMQRNPCLCLAQLKNGMITCVTLYNKVGQGDIPSFYTYEEGLSRLTTEGQATLERLEGMLAQSISTQYHMAGVRTEESVRDFEDGMEVDAAPAVAGQFEDADVDH